MRKKNHRGSEFRDFLKEQGILAEVEARALKQAMSLQIFKKSANARGLFPR
jgi:hypothetical protein